MVPGQVVVDRERAVEFGAVQPARADTAEIGEADARDAVERCRRQARETERFLKTLAVEGGRRTRAVRGKAEPELVQQIRPDADVVRSDKRAVLLRVIRARLQHIVRIERRRVLPAEARENLLPAGDVMVAADIELLRLQIGALIRVPVVAVRDRRAAVVRVREEGLLQRLGD